MLNLVFRSTLEFPTKDVSYTSTRLGRVRAALPQEYKLLKFIENVSNRHTSWKADTPACEWDGVTCNEEGKVVKIRWQNRLLEGSLEWKNLPDTLLELSMHSNNLFGSIVLEDLPPHLEYLSLGTNHFTGGVTLQAMPKTMKKLLIGNNELSGSIRFGDLPDNLCFLYLADNADLSGTLMPSELSPTLEASVYTDRTKIITMLSTM